MIMEHLKHAVCPECGCADVARFEVSIQGNKRREQLTFACSYLVSYSPNTEQISIDDDCRRSARGLRWTGRRVAMAEAMIQAAKDYVGRADIDLSTLERNLVTDLDSYRNELEASCALS